MYRVFSAILFLMMTASLLYAAQGRVIILYGDYAQWCTVYVHAQKTSGERAEQVLEKYFASKG